MLPGSSLAAAMQTNFNQWDTQSIIHVSIILL